MTPAERVAAVAPIAEFILPSNATPYERAMLEADLAALTAIDPAVIATIWDPMRCPTILLPWLAWALSVDVWDNTWTEERKRKVVAASPLVHRLKGTRGAVRRALDAFDLESRIVEWWEETPAARRGTFRVETIYRDGAPEFDPTTQSQAIEAVAAAKPKSRVFTTRAVIQARGPAYVGAYSHAHIGAIAHPFVFEGATVRASGYVGGTAAAFFSATAQFTTAVPPAPATFYADFARGVYFRNDAWRAFSNAVDFARDSAGRAFDEDGAYQVAASDVLRVGHGASGGAAIGAVLEGARTNRLLNTSTFSAEWSGNGSTRTVIPNGSFDGNVSAMRVTTTGNFGGNLFQQIFGLTIGSTVVASVWIKGTAGEQIYFGADDKPETLKRITFTGDWQYIALDPYEITVSDVYFTFELYDRVAGDHIPTGGTFDICYPQYEVAGTPSSYIESGGTVGTRAADALSVGPVGGLPFEGYVATVLSGVIAFRAAPGASGNQVLWQTDDGSEDDRLRIVRDATGHLRFIATAGGAEQCNIDLGALADSTDGKVAFRAAANDFAAVLDGGAVSADSAGSMPAVTLMWVGRGHSGDEWFGHVGSVSLHASALTNTKLQSLSA